METNNQKNDIHGNPLSDWVKSSTELWGHMTQMWPNIPTGQEKKGTPKSDDGNGHPFWQPFMSSWQEIASNISEKGQFESFFNKGFVTPEALTNMVQHGWNDFTVKQKQLFENASKLGNYNQLKNIETISQDVFNTWSELYEKEFRKFTNIPQVGLTRAYQEKLVILLDKYNIFLTSMSEFTFLLFQPMEKSFKAMQEELLELGKSGKLPEDFKDYYRSWLKKLENYYMELFKSKEYTQKMGKALDAMESFIFVRDELIQDLLKMFPIPTQKEMDGLYKDIYQLKKRVQKLEKERKANKIKEAVAKNE